MAGMIQILTYLLCVYLVFKGLEIFQIAFLAGNDHPNRSIMSIIGILALVAAIGLAALFAAWQDSQARSISGIFDKRPVVLEGR
jgi:uncharacterized membrane protein (DUF485 family)